MTTPDPAGVYISSAQMYQELRSLSDGLTRVETKLDGIGQFPPSSRGQSRSALAPFPAWTEGGHDRVNSRTRRSVSWPGGRQLCRFPDQGLPALRGK